MSRVLVLIVALLAATFAAAAPAPQDGHEKGEGPKGGEADIVRMSASQQRAAGVSTESVVMHPIIRTLHVPGAIVLDPTRTARLRPFAEARVVRLLVQPGEIVAAGSPLAELSSGRVATAQQELLTQRAMLREAEAGIAVARDALRRGVILARDGALAWAEAERRRLLLVQAQAQAQAVRARIAAGRVELASLGGAGAVTGLGLLATPIAGTVASVGVTPGEVIGPGMSGDAFTIADLSRVEALAEVPEGQTSEARVGDKAGVQLASGGTMGWSGTVVAIGSAIDPRSRTLPVRISLANADGALRAGMLVDVVLFDDEGRQGLIVPPDAVQRVGSRQVVFTPLGGGRFRARDVTLGVQREDWVQVRKGLAAGEQVVTSGSFALKSVMQSAQLGAQ